MHNIFLFFKVYRNKAAAPSSFCSDGTINWVSSASFGPWAEILGRGSSLEVDGITVFGSGILKLLAPLSSVRVLPGPLSAELSPYHPVALSSTQKSFLKEKPARFRKGFRDKQQIHRVRPDREPKKKREKRKWWIRFQPTQDKAEYYCVKYGKGSDYILSQIFFCSVHKTRRSKREKN